MQQNVSPNVRTTPPPASADLPAALANESGSQRAKLTELRERANSLELRVSDLTARVSQLDEQRHTANSLERPKLDKQWLDARHDYAAASIELRSLHDQMGEIDRSMNAQPVTAPAPPSLPAITLQPPASPFLDGMQIMQLAGGAGMLMIPLVLVAARNLWVRGSRKKAETADIESSPRLQRIEQSIEAIAVEVERIGEAQRFSTKLLSERQPDPIVNRAAASPVPRVITPH